MSFSFPSTQKSIYNDYSRIICIGDIHGDYGKLVRLLMKHKIINNKEEWIAEPVDTYVVQIGDQTDLLNRIPGNTYKDEDNDAEIILFLNRLHKKAQKKGGAVLSLMGNHELMNVMGDFSYASPLAQQNPERITLFRPGGKIALNLSLFNSVLKIGPFLFCHAGVLPHISSAFDINQINNLMRKFLRNKRMTKKESEQFENIFVNNNSILWNRKYTPEYYKANKEEFEKNVNQVLKDYKCKSMVVGHTPQDNVTRMYGNKVIMVDVGLSKSFKSTNSRVLEIVDNKAKILE